MINFLIRNRIVASILFYILWGSNLFVHIFNLDELASQINWTARGLLLIFWIIILQDMVRKEIKDKPFWILSMFLLPFFAPVVYLFRRKNLLHLRSNKFKSGRKF